MTDYKKWQEIEDSIPEDEDDAALKRLREQKDNMSNEEVRRLHECWEKPEFKQMFHEYAEEVSDPAHRAETEKYLQQVEGEQRAEKQAKEGFLNGRSTSEFDSLNSAVPGQPDGPEGAQLLKPNKGFVIKTWQKQPGRSEFDRELGKLFINVCTHEEIDRPTAQEVTAPDGRQGQTWSMPHLCSPKVKEEKDRAGHKCSVVDIVFHTEVLARCSAPNGIGERWKGMVAETALNMVGKLHQLELDTEGHKVLNTKYFGDTGEGPSMLSWKPDGKPFEEKDLPQTKRSPKAQANAKAAEAAKPKPTQSPAAAAAATKPPTVIDTTPKPKAAPPPPSSKETKAPPKYAAGKSPEPPPPKLLSKGPAKPTTKAPKYSIVHRGVGDSIANSWNDNKLSTSGRPRELCVKIELEELTSAGEIDLDITERNLELKHEGVGYALSLSLPYPVLSEQGSAKFDKAKRVLTVTLPVAAAAAPMPQWEPVHKGQTEEERAAEEAAEKAAEAEAKAKAEAEAEEKREAERAARIAKAKQEEAEREARKAAAIAQAEREAAKRAAKVQQQQEKAKAEANKPKPALAAPAPPPAPPKPKPVAEVVNPPAEEVLKKENASESDSERGSQSDWVEVSEAEAAAAKIASPGREKAKEEEKPVIAKEKENNKADAQPTGKGGGLPALSNNLLFQLD